MSHGPSLDSAEVIRLTAELARVRAQAQVAADQAAALHEELRVANDELLAEHDLLERANERQRADAAELAAVGNDLTCLLASIDLAVLFLDPHFCLRRFTPAVRHLIDLIPADVGRPLTELRWKFIDPSLRADVKAVCDQLSPDEREVAAEGGRLYLRRALPHRAADGHINGAVVTFQDVTARRQLEEQFRQAQKMEAVGRLAAGVAHDFNNLLTVIGGYSKLLLESAQVDAPWREPLTHIYHAGRQAADLTRQLLAFSRKSSPVPRTVDPATVSQNAVQLVRRLIGPDVTVVCDLVPGGGCVRTDPAQLEQAVINLCVNARDAMPAGGTLTVSTRPMVVPAGRHGVTPGRYVVVRVADTGGGMDAATRARIFEPFFTTKGVGQGTGLGLPMVYGFARQSGGFVEVESEPGRGATFDVYLPRVDEAATVTGSGVLPPPKPTAGACTVLLVDDDAAVRGLTGHVLRRCGYVVLEAEDGPSAVAVAAHAGSIRLILADVMMPGGMRGPEVAAAIKKTHPEAKVLYVSGYSGDDVLGADEGAAFLAKPFTPAALAVKVQKVLGGAI